MSQNVNALIDSLLFYAVRFAETNEEPSDGDCCDTIEKTRAFFAAIQGQPTVISPSVMDLIDSLLCYAVRFAETNEEPSDGNCWDTIEKTRAFFAALPPQPSDLMSQDGYAGGRS